ncbi:hypothetical protein ACHAPT_005633 [Fusarium lateritium]
MVRNLRQGVEMIIVPKAEVAAFETQGWEVYPVDVVFRDRRPVDLPVDVVSYDQPAADTMRYVEHGNNFISSTVTKDNWLPGQLIEVSERRSATSTGHILQHPRPAGVCLGWGDYDKYTHWQSYGRRVPKDMVEKKYWQMDPLAPVRLVNDSGEVVETVTNTFKREHVPSQTQKPVPLYDLVNSGDVRKLKTPARGTSTTLAWPGTYNDDE